MPTALAAQFLSTPNGPKRIVIVMDEITAQRHSKHRLFGFWARYRAKQDQDVIQVLSDPAGRHDVQAAQTAQRSSRAKAAGEAGRGGQYLGG